MSRFLSFAPFALATFGVGLALTSWSVVGCGSAALLEGSSGSADASMVRRDAAPVDPSEAGPPLESEPPPPPSCEKYCGLVMSNCTGDNAQYGSTEECLALCAHLPLVQPTREAEEKKAASVACRQYWADAPARTSPESYCLAAGPFGGNTCGDRCTAFCDVALSACSPDSGASAYASRSDCRTTCLFTFSYRDAGDDGGGEGPDGPRDGDSFNCRLYWLRAATMDAQKCGALAPNSDACKD